MDESGSNVRTLYWKDETFYLLDQRVLPQSLEYIACRNVNDVIEAIATMVVRGAPAIGVAAAFGVALAVRSAYEIAGARWREEVAVDLDKLKAARPTAINLAWAVDMMAAEFARLQGDPFIELLALAEAIARDDVASNRAMGDFGAAFIQADSKVLTHCNAGALATAGYGTALGVIRSAHEQQSISQVFATETRPWLQGARLTAWELQQDSIPVSLITDSAAAHFMREQNIAWVITGADRVAANGDVANKIGTYSLAVCARAHGVKFMVAAPCSTIDRSALSGADIPIENRAASELLEFRGEPIAAVGINAQNPVFDITPAHLIDVLVTDKGAIEHPNVAQISALF